MFYYFEGKLASCIVSLQYLLYMSERFRQQIFFHAVFCSDTTTNVSIQRLTTTYLINCTFNGYKPGCGSEQPSITWVHILLLITSEPSVLSFEWNLVTDIRLEQFNAGTPVPRERNKYFRVYLCLIWTCFVILSMFLNCLRYTEAYIMWYHKRIA